MVREFSIWLLVVGDDFECMGLRVTVIGEWIHDFLVGEKVLTSSDWFAMASQGGVVVGGRL